MLDCRIRRTKRKKTMALRVEADGQVTITIPRFLKLEAVKKLVDRKIEWIRNQQEIRRQMRIRYPKKEFASGEAFTIFGRTYRLLIKNKKGTEGCFINKNRLEVGSYPLSKKKIKSILEKLLRVQTIKQANEGISRYSVQLGVKVRKVFAANQSKRWGSCSKKGNIRINWKLAMTPLPVFNYVVAHEVCHLKYHDHSQRFWQALKSIAPNYEKSRSWLKENMGLIMSFG